MKFQDAIEIVRSLNPTGAGNGHEEYLWGYMEGGQNALDDAVTALEDAHRTHERRAQLMRSNYLHGRARMNHAEYMRTLPSPVDLTENFLEASHSNY